MLYLTGIKKLLFQLYECKIINYEKGAVYNKRYLQTRWRR